MDNRGQNHMKTSESEAQSDAQEVLRQAGDLRDAAINMSAAAWRVTGLEARDLIRAGAHVGQPVSLEELAFASENALGWAELSERASQIAEMWTRAAENWRAAAAHVQTAKPMAIAELRREHVDQEQRRIQCSESELVMKVQERQFVHREAFQSHVKPTYRTIRHRSSRTP